MILKCVLTSNGEVDLLSKVLVFGFALIVPLVVSTFSLTSLRPLSVQLSPRWQLGLGKYGQAAVPAARGTNAVGIKSGRKRKVMSKISQEWKEAKASRDVKIGRCVERDQRESTWKADEVKMIGLVFTLEGKRRGALTGKLASGDLSEHAERGKV